MFSHLIEKTKCQLKVQNSFLKKSEKDLFDLFCSNELIKSH